MARAIWKGALSFGFVNIPVEVHTAVRENRPRFRVLDFVEAEALDDRFLDRPYYLTPGAGGDEAHALLREAIREPGRIGLASSSCATS